MNHLGSSVSGPVSRTHKRMLYWSGYIKMLHTAELDMANTVDTSDTDTFSTNTAWATCSTYHTVLKASPGAAIFSGDMLFDTPFLADWNKIGEHRQLQTNLNMEWENHSCRDCNLKVGDQVFLRKDGIIANQKVGMRVILRLSQWFIQMGQSTKSECLNIW